MDSGKKQADNIAPETQTGAPIFIGKQMLHWQEADESELLEAACNGDAHAFGQLYEGHIDRIFRYLYGRLYNHQDAEDLAEETFLRVWRTLPRYKDRGLPFTAYLYRVAHNTLVDHFRRSNGKEALPLHEHLVSDPAETPSQAVAANVQREEIRELLTQLREDYQTVLMLRFLSELSPDEVAQVMGRSSGAVRVLQHRALTALRELMDGSMREM